MKPANHRSITEPQDLPKVTVTRGDVRQDNRVGPYHPVNSAYVTLFWTRVIGPSGICLIRAIDELLTNLNVESTEIDTYSLGHIIGVRWGGKHSTGRKAMNRLLGYHLAQWDETTSTYTVLTELPRIPYKELSHLPTDLRPLHQQLIEQALVAS